MHFPTSLPPTSGSPAAKLSLESGGSPHPETFDGPLPPLSRPEFSRTKLPLRPRPTESRVFRLAGPRFPPPGHLPSILQRPVPLRGTPRYSMPNLPLLNPDTSLGTMPSSFTTEKMKIKGGLPTERLLEARNSWKRKRKARLDGARKPDLVGNFQGPEYGGDAPRFEKKQEDTERGSSGIPMSSKYNLKKIFGIGHELEKPIAEYSQRIPPIPTKLPTMEQPHRNLSSDTGNSRRYSGKLHNRMTLRGPRERLIANRASREEDKEDFGEASGLDEFNNYTSGSERRRMSSQMKKLSINEFQDRYEAHRDHKRSEKEAELARVQKIPEEVHEKHHGFTEAVKCKIMVAKEELQSYQSTRCEERGDTKERTGARIVNAVRAARARLEDREAEREDKRQGIRPKPATHQPRECPREQLQFLATPRRVPIFSSPSYNQRNSSSSPPLDQQNTPYFEADDPQSPKATEIPRFYKTLSPPVERNRTYQQVFPARPSLPYRPTLSPVYSKSPIPTNSLSQVTSISQNPPKAFLNDPSSFPIDIQAEIVPAPVSLNLSQSTSRSSPPTRIEHRHEETSRKSPPSSISTVTRERTVQSTNRTLSLKNKGSHRHPRQSLTTEDEIPPLKLPSPEVRPVSLKEVPFHKIADPKRASFNTQAVFQSQNLEAELQQPADPKDSHEAIHKDIDFVKTPTSSTLEFWAVADASLVPSESASAQPANRRGEPPPDIWKDADRTLDLRKAGPTMEEWIAGLPGLGLRLGLWAEDSNLDSKILEDLRTKSPESSTIRGDEILRAELVKKLKEMDNKALKQAEELIPEDEVELTPEEVKTLELLEYDLVSGNAPPTVIDPSLLHPDYIPSPSPSMTSVLVPFEPRRLSIVQQSDEGGIHSLTRAHLPRAASEEMYGLIDSPSRQLERPSDLARDVTSRLDALEKYWDKQGIVVGTILRRMLWIVDTMIIKEREDTQRLVRRKEMGWTEDGYGSEDAGGGKA